MHTRYLTVTCTCTRYFIVVPGAINLVQGPTNYHRLLRLGVPPEQLRLAGACIPKDLVDNLEADCNARIARAAARKPVRLLIPVGGAGAQRTFVSNFVTATGPLLKACNPALQPATPFAPACDPTCSRRASCSEPYNPHPLSHPLSHPGQAGKLQLFLNAADHVHMKAAFQACPAALSPRANTAL